MIKKSLKSTLTASVFLCFALFLLISPVSAKTYPSGCDITNGEDFLSYPFSPVSDNNCWINYDGFISEVEGHPDNNYRVLNILGASSLSSGVGFYYFGDNMDVNDYWEYSSEDWTFDFEYKHEQNRIIYFSLGDMYDGSTGSIFGYNADPGVFNITIDSKNDVVKFGLQTNDVTSSSFGFSIPFSDINADLINDFVDYHAGINKDGNPFLEIDGQEFIDSNSFYNESGWTDINVFHIGLDYGDSFTNDSLLNSFNRNSEEYYNSGAYTEFTDFNFPCISYKFNFMDDPNYPPDNFTDLVYFYERIYIYDSNNNVVDRIDFEDGEAYSGSTYLREDINLSSYVDFSQYEPGDYTAEVFILPFFSDMPLTDSQDFSISEYADLNVNISPSIDSFNSNDEVLDFSVDYSGVSESYDMEVFLRVDDSSEQVDSFSFSSDGSKSYSVDVSNKLGYGSAETEVTAVLYQDGQPYSFSSGVEILEHDGSFGGQFPEVNDALSRVRDGAMSLLRPFKQTFLNFLDNLQKQFPFNFFYSGVDAFNTAYEDFQELEEPNYPELVMEWDFAGQEYSVNMFPMERLMTEDDLYNSGFNASGFFEVLRGIAGASMIVSFLLYLFKMIPARVMKLSNKPSE